MGPTDHVFLYRNQPISKDLIHGWLKAAGDRARVKVHARAHDQAMEADYFTAMSRIEQRLELAGQAEETPKAVNGSEREQLRSLAEQLFTPELSYEMRLEIAVQMCSLLGGGEPTRVDWIPPPAPVLANVETA